MRRRTHHRAAPLRSPAGPTCSVTVVAMDEDVLAEAAKGLRVILDAVERGELTAESVEELKLVLRLEGAVAALRSAVGDSSPG